MNKARKKLNPFTVIGELLLLGGIGTFGFLLWQPWYTGTVVTQRQAALSAEISAQWHNTITDSGSTTEGVPVARSGSDGVFGVMYVPAFGRVWANTLATHTNMNYLLNNGKYGIAHYSTTTLPGQPGNIGLAAHRSGGITSPFHDTDFLRVGDPIFIETADGWYTYRFRDYEYVLPEAVDVLNPFPRVTDAKATDQILTFTTCNPKYYGADERMIAYSVFEGFTPRSAGAPAELRKANPNLAKSYENSVNTAAQVGGY